MSWLDLSAIAQMLGTSLLGADGPVTGVCTDSRRVGPQELFIALKGARFDAHEFIDSQMQAAGIVVTRELAVDLPQLVVKDTRLALGDLARQWRSSLRAPVIGLTGSNGKTTVKEMIAAILATQGQVYATRGNLNNDIGLPLSLLALRETHDYAVMEMGANHFGEIDYLTHIACPDVALITNAAAAHLEGFKDLDGVARAKGEIFSGLREDGIAVINADDIYAEYWRSKCRRHQVVSFGFADWADVRGQWEPGGPLQIGSGDDGVSIDLPLAGRHNAANALAAATAALAVGVTLMDVKQALETMTPVAGRLQRKQARSGLQIIDDSYNANPASLEAAIEVLAAEPAPRCLVLGDMGELGAAAGELHRAMGRLAHKAGIERLYTLGEFARGAAAAFGSEARSFSDCDALIQALQEDLGEPATVLVKGSRYMRMERVVAALLGDNAKTSVEGNGHAA